MAAPVKACPVLLRASSGAVQVLAFEHPHAGFQLVKGGIEEGESPEAAAVREMYEEAGIRIDAVRSLGVIEPVPGQLWSLTLCVAQTEVPERFAHRTDDDGGHEFRFFWHSLSDPPGEEWAASYVAVLSHLRENEL